MYPNDNQKTRLERHALVFSGEIGRRGAYDMKEVVEEGELSWEETEWEE